MQTIVVVVHVLVSVALVGLVLIQHGKGADAGAAFGSGSAGTVFGARGPASFLTRATAVLATIFFLTSLTLAWFSTRSVRQESVVERIQEAPAQPAASGPPADVPSDVPGSRAPGQETGQDTGQDSGAAGGDLPPGAPSPGSE